MVFTMLPVSALAADVPSETVSATIQHELDSAGNKTGQMTASIEAYMTDPANKTRRVKPCDIIFLIEQSKFMNTQNGSATAGNERAEILNAMERLLDGMPTPTTGGEHRVAIAGYGRINHKGYGDTYDPKLYPGTKPSSTPSLNTGYYTLSNGDPEFHSQGGWTEWNAPGGTDDDKTALPKLPENYLTGTAYNTAFMTVADAKQVIDVDKMVPWYAGAARMDAGLTIAEQLAQIAKAAKASSESGEDRNLIICIAASSLPYQNSNSFQMLREEAAVAAAKKLKEEYGATIFGLGDFHPLNLQGEMSDPEKQRDNFNATMATICGNKDTDATTGAAYFKGLSQVHDIDEALNELMTKIDANVGAGATEEMKLNVGTFQEIQPGDAASPAEHSWSEVKTNHHILLASNIRESASVDYYRFTGYDRGGNPQFEAKPSRHTELSLADIGRGNSIQTALTVLPVPPQGEGAPYGEKVVITISDPVCIDYEWIGRWSPELDPPAHEHAARTTTHTPASPTQNKNPGDQLHLKFGGWYRLCDEAVDSGSSNTWTYDGNTYVKYTGTVFPSFGSDLKLFGRWLPEIHVNFHWAGSVIPGDEDGKDIEPPSALTLPLNENGTYQYQAEKPAVSGYEFDGWYQDAACTEKYDDSGETLTANTDLYGRWVKLGTKEVTFQVENGAWNTESEWYKSGTASDDGSSTVTVQVPLRDGKGTLASAQVPSLTNSDMTPGEGYKAPGAWSGDAPNTNADAITEDGEYHYTYTFPNAEAYTVTYCWTSDTTETPEDVTLPEQQSQLEDQSGGKPTFTIASVSAADTGWNFTGWNTKDDLQGTTYNGGAAYTFDNGTSEKNITLYGKWTHDPCTVIFRADYEGLPSRGSLLVDDEVNGEGADPWSCQVPYGSSLSEEKTALPVPIPGSEAAWYFKDWDLDEDNSDDLFYMGQDILEMPVRSDLTFIAQWWPVVTFHANSGAWEDNSTEQHVKVPAGADKIDPVSPPVRDGYTFLGWYDGDGRLIDFETETINENTGPKEYYAHWAEHVTVTFRIVNGTWSGGETEDKTVPIVLYPQADGSASGTLDASYVPQIMIPNPGYESAVGGWDVVPNTEPNGISQSVTYTYKFDHAGSGGDVGGGHGGGTVTTKYTLTYESNGGTQYKDERYPRNTAVQLNKLPSREGYQLTGWYADKDLTQKISEVKMTSDKTVYAGWRASTVPDMLNGDSHFAYVVGYTDGTVRPLDHISRAEVAAIFFRLLKPEVRDGNLTERNTFSDVTEGMWCNTAISTAARLGIVKGRSQETFDPDASITRAEAMTMINRVLCRIPETESDLLPGMTIWPDNQPDAWYYLAVQEATNSHSFTRKGEAFETWTALTKDPDWNRYEAK
ncbi:MAG: InlB B-repeat-containing protein [Eubacteriales bacterium]|nr:InlB B-repeat-containing protein [Eubacteriales bacterium]